MAVNFPSNPTNGQTITVSGITYAYDSTQGVWSDNPQGLTQAIDALTDVDTSTVAPTNGQVLQWNSTDSEWQPADSSAGVTVYATINDLPLSGVAEGSMALVDSTDKLYIFSDSGWYSISIVNTTPSISGVSATYTLATDGTATVVTVTATDAEGIPLTYSIVSDTSGNVATVTQGTGSNTNQWTITPSTNTANAGSFTLVFRASDGTNVASASSTFTLQFSVENSNYTTALITSVGANNAVNNSFTDSSTNNHTITASGNVTQNTFSPYRHGGYSTYFDGAGDYLSLSSVALGASEFTLEFWVYLPSSVGASQSIIDWRPSNTNGSYIAVWIDSTDKIGIYSNTQWALLSASALPISQWVHICFVRDSSNIIKLYIDGVVETSTFTSSTNYTAVTNRPLIGTSAYHLGLGGAQYEFQGYLTDFRCVSGTAITPASGGPTERLTAVTNTKLLTCHLPYIADGSTNAHSITVNGNTKTEAFSPYEHAGYSTADHGGSIYFDGSGDYAVVANDASLQMGTGDFTFEWWWNPDHYATMRPLCVLGTGAGSWSIVMLSNGTFDFVFGTSAVFTSSINYAINKWTHIAIVRESGTVTCYVDGVSQRTASNSYNQNATTGIGIGYDSAAPSQVFKGSLADVRIVKGTAVYTSAFTPPTAPLTAITNTSLLLNGTDAGIIDKSQSVKTITLNGDVKSSTTQSKYLTSSMYFDGTGDYLTMSPSNLFAFRTGDFTIEGWAYITASGDKGLFQQGTSNFPATNTNSVALQITNAAPADSEWAIYAANAYHESTVNYALNQWYHFAVVRASSVTKLYIDGTQALSVADTADYTGTYFGIGSIYGAANAQCFSGHISDFRITKGLARYTSNFTPPSAALEG